MTDSPCRPATDPVAIIDEQPMRRLQIVAVALGLLLVALDGFDILSISFASPGISADWGVSKGTLGVVLGMELVGMMAGSLALGAIADRLGRKAVLLFCLVLMAGGMLATAVLARDIATLSVFRLITGFGIGGMLAATNAVVAEFANARNRSMAVSLMATGYPLGGVAGGAIATHLLAEHSWRSVFAFGAVLTVAFIPAVLLLLPESVPFLIERRPANALARINRTLGRLGHPVMAALPERPATGPAMPAVGPLRPPLRGRTLLLTFVYFVHILTFYYLLKWVPKLVADMGFTASAAGGVLVYANIGGLIGAFAFSGLVRLAPLRPLTVSALLLSAVAVAGYGQMGADLTTLSIVAAVACFFTNAGIVGIYALTAESYPAPVRAGGTGIVIGIGRGGAALSPMVVGQLFQHGVSVSLVSALVAIGSLAGAIVLLAFWRPLRGRW